MDGGASVIERTDAILHSPDPGHPLERLGEEQLSWFARYSMALETGLTLVFLLAGWLLGRFDLIPNGVEVAFYVAAYLTGGTRASMTAVQSLLHRNIDVDLLMVTAAVGAAIIGHWVEGGVLLFLFSLGGTLEHYAMGRTYSAIRALMDLRPEEALVEREGVEQMLPVGELLLGDHVIVRPGERIAADGEVARGESSVDQSAITGESIPATKRPGDNVFAGTINGRGVLHLRVTRLANESVLAKIIDIVEQAQAEKSGMQRFTDRFEGLYAGGVIAAAALYLAFTWLVTGHDLADAFYHAMILLVVASPCALVISTPASTLSALANAARHGILFKGAAHLENMGVAKVVAFDKTGTLTVGKPRLTDVEPLAELDTNGLLALAASVERLSEHTLAQSVVDAARERGLTLREVSGVEAVVGQGIQARVGTDTVLIGNDALFTSGGHELDERAVAVANRLRDDGKSTMFVGCVSDGALRLLGVLGVSDTVRPVARETVERLKALGVEKTIILTGDNERAARAIARQAGVDEYRAGLLPQEKLDIIEELKRQYGSVVMVGDGVNDAPALATATIGVAMGAAGTDVALETADVVLMADDLTRLPYAIALSRRTRRIIRQNLTFALSVIAILVIGTLLQLTTLPIGVVGHEGSTIVVVTNGLRLLGGGSAMSDAGAHQPRDTRRKIPLIGMVR